MTFGPVGRIAATLAVVLFIWWMHAFLGIFAVVFICAAAGMLVQAFRDIWRPTRVAPTEADRIRLQAEAMARAEQPIDEPITDRAAPPRW